MNRSRFALCAIFCLLCGAGRVAGQRTYAPRSVLADGSWHKIAVKEAGIYKIDAAQLQSMGISTANLASGSIRLFGNGGGMIPEDNAVPRPDDLRQNAIFVEDGGDGLFNGGDFLLFYAPGPHRWARDGSGYYHTSHLYSDSACYFVNIAPGGLRINTDTAMPAATRTVTAYDFHTVYEKDEINILSSGKQWFGQLFSTVPGGVAERSYALTAPAGLTAAILRIRLAARSSSGARFDLSLGNNAIKSFLPPPVSGNIFETYASTVTERLTVAGAGNFTLRFTGNSGAQGWLDFIAIEGRSPLALPAQGVLMFRDNPSTGAGQTAGFELANGTAQTMVWDVSIPHQPVRLAASLTGSTLRFSRDAAVLREYAAFNPAVLPAPLYVGPVANQDLHGLSAQDMLIVCPAAFQPAANRLAAWHGEKHGLKVAVVPTEQVWNEFGSGIGDPAALRDLLKMLHDRGGLRYVLLLGRASCDYKDRVRNNTNFVPTWQSDNSLHGINSYMSDDFYGFLGDRDDINGSGALLDAAVGRLPVRIPQEADAAVNKIIQYNTPADFGPWRQEMTFVADDEDGNLHLEDAEIVSNIVAGEESAFNIGKLYLDAFPQVSATAGSRYPAVNEAIRQRMYSGNLVWNYTGHGTFNRLAEEAVLEESAIDGWQNAGRLPLMVTATCDFAPFDNPDFNSLGEKLLLRENGGAIALMTTTRAVFAYSNLVMNANYFRRAFSPGAGGRMPTLGEGAMLAKNDTYSQNGDVINNRKFQLLGDPAMPLAFPEWTVNTDSLNGREIQLSDSLKALGKYTLSGSVRDGAGNLQSGYSGILDVTVYDKPAGRNTRGNDPGSSPVSFAVQDRILFRGRDTVQNGRFRFTFVVPKDMSQADGNARISYYTSNAREDGGGFYNRLAANGTAPDAPEDNEGPAIRAWMNDRGFTSGDITNENPLLLINLRDANGINATGNGIGHDITAILDDSTQFFILNEFHEALPGDYREGNIRFPMAGLAPGEHTLTIRAWDSYNNSTTINIRFTVIPKSSLAVEKVGNYPNPFRGQTRFIFYHNQQGVDVDVVIRIFTAAGQNVSTIRRTINTGNGRYDGVSWNGTADTGARVTPGIYFYQIVVKGRDNTQKVFGGQLILL
ncbi:type IX secretion system sortase PorU [Chitinophaga barathri]|uniref:T9SS C-terminal target domain-containing protein n=1 Tax=Chitinophaga barathri TaxID=1647451 RepID=A0A3N4M6M8_9BACT|nr:type IX secretion system sortase PorU [Chitinophaga barathri]RPD39044.1 T9SS C-terminal target domain-containing protein [Chitinophaga barathri]